MENKEEGQEMELNTVHLFGEGEIFLVNSKMKNGKLYCDVCGNALPAINPFFVVLNVAEREVYCHPCNNKRLGIVPKVYNPKEYVKPIIAPKPPKEKKVKKLKEKKKDSGSQFNMFE